MDTGIYIHLGKEGGIFRQKKSINFKNILKGVFKKQLYMLLLTIVTIVYVGFLELLDLITEGLAL